MNIKKYDSWIKLSVILVPPIITIYFGQEILKLVSQDFIKNYLLLLAFSIFGLGFSALHIEEKRKELKKDLLNATIWIMFSILFAMIYSVHNGIILISPFTFGHISMICFLAGFLYFFLIILKLRLLLI